MANYTCIFEDTRVVDKYPRLRHVPSGILSLIAERVVDLSASTPNKNIRRVLDAGAGSGRFFLPFLQAARESSGNVRIIALDLSLSMLSVLKESASQAYRCNGVCCIQSDLQSGIPLTDKSIDVVFTAATFHILKEWRQALDYLVDVIVPSGYFLLLCEYNQFMHETEGFERDSDFPYLDTQLRELMDFYHEQRQICGEPYEPSEVRYSDVTRMVDHLKALGFVELSSGIELPRLQWQKAHSYEDILYCFRHRQMTTWGSDLSEEARAQIADALDVWVKERRIDVDEDFFLHACLIPRIFKKPGRP